MAEALSDLLSLQGVWLGGRRTALTPSAGLFGLLEVQGVWFGGRRAVDAPRPAATGSLVSREEDEVLMLISIAAAL